MKTREIITLAMACVIIVGMYPAFGSDTSNKSVGSVTVANTYADWNTSPTVQTVNKVDVCIYKPYDGYIDSQLPSIVLNKVQSYNVTAKVVSVREQVEKQGSDCNYVIKIDRAINENYRYTERTTKYIVSGHVATVFSYKTGAPFDPAHVPTTTMTNYNCMLQAHNNKYFSNYHIEEGGFEHTYQGYCNPYAQSNPEKVGELPTITIRQSVDEVLKNFGL